MTDTTKKTFTFNPDAAEFTIPSSKPVATEINQNYQQHHQQHLQQQYTQAQIAMMQNAYHHANMYQPVYGSYYWADPAAAMHMGNYMQHPMYSMSPSPHHNVNKTGFNKPKGTTYNQNTNNPTTITADANVEISDSVKVENTSKDTEEVQVSDEHKQTTIQVADVSVAEEIQNKSDDINATTSENVDETSISETADVDDVVTNETSDATVTIAKDVLKISISTSELEDNTQRPISDVISPLSTVSDRKGKKGKKSNNLSSASIDTTESRSPKGDWGPSVPLSPMHPYIARPPLENISNLLKVKDLRRYDKLRMLALFVKSGPNKRLRDLYPRLSNREHVIRGVDVAKKIEDDAVLEMENNIFKSLRTSNEETKKVEESEDDRAFKKAQLILNKLSPTNFDKLSKEFIDIGFHNEDVMIKIMELIVDKAQLEENFCFMYANLCKLLSNNLPSEITFVKQVEGLQDSKTFTAGEWYREKLLERCRDEFSVQRAEKILEIKKLLIPEEQKEMKEIALKRRYTGHIRFIGELFIQDMIKAKIIVNCIDELLVSKEEEDLVCLCKLFRTVGSRLDDYFASKSQSSAQTYYQFFKEIEKLSEEHHLSRVRFMLKDLIDLRANKWKARRTEAKVQKLSEIRAETSTSSAPPTPRTSNQNVRRLPRQSISSSNVAVSASSPRPIATTQQDEWQTQPVNIKSRSSRTTPRTILPSREANTKRISTDTFVEKTNNTIEDEVEADDIKDKLDCSLSTSQVKSVKSALQEYLSNELHEEFVTCLSEFKVQHCMSEVFKLVLDTLVDSSESNHSKLYKLILMLRGGEQVNGSILSEKDLVAGFELFIMNLEDIIVDAPKSWKYVGDALAYFITSDGILSLDTFPDTICKLDFPRKADILGQMFTSIGKNLGQSRAEDIYVQSKLDFSFLLKNEIDSKADINHEKDLFLQKFDKFPFSL